MTREEIYKARLAELKPLIFALQSAIEVFGRDKAKELAEAAFTKYADDRFVREFRNIPLDERWAKFLEDRLNGADDIQYSIDMHEENMVKVRYLWCVFLDIFRKYGLEDFVPLYCETDFITCQKIHTGITLSRTETMAMGAPYCDHCWEFTPE